jgi:aminoglycoside phosphotransferase family enzyme
VAGNQTKQSELVASLLKPQAYPHPVAHLELIETHISWVILTGTFAYKIKKSVKLEFLDFSSLRLRRHYCDEELRLNRRLAPQLYLDVVPI